ncbi:UPF0392 protein F13G3.3 [Elysia marginata]|uniref:UPF0392 protein F13G3.3 n=1 Tax=Elysia marginata TaxID=1093978 RepID=A0AAV4J982_9GAST|nr:UPF0392 protein F13G3.3 [Elysia marginata]
MVSLAKRLQAYAAPVLLVYTVMVTWVLISTAWSEHSQQDGTLARERYGVGSRELAGGSGKSFLDVIVQEERRHMNSFKNAVRSFKVAVGEGDGNKTGKRTDSESPAADKTKRDRFARRRNVPVGDVSSKPRSFKRKINKKNNRAPERQSQGATYKSTNTEKRLGSMVEVEAWDQSRGKYPTNIKNKRRQSISSLKEQAAAASPVAMGDDSKLKSKRTPAIKNQTSNAQEYTFLKFCDQVFQDSHVVPNICDRPSVELRNKKHIPVPKTSLDFCRLGEMKVFSAFLDARGEPFVRTMVLAPSGQKNGPSIYWCVFYNLENTSASSRVNPIVQDDADNKLLSETFHKDQDVISRSAENGHSDKNIIGSTVMSFYAASDGHGHAFRFYIASCPVQHNALYLFSHTNKSVSIQIRVGSLETAFLGAVQETIFVDVINNKPIEKPAQPPGPINKQKFGKTLLVDVKALKTEKQTNSLAVSVENFQVSDNSSSRHEDENRKAISVFELDDDDEDKEISREKKHLSKSSASAGNVKTRSDGSIIIPYPDSKDVGDTIVSCVAPLHARAGAMQLVEFVELSLLLGIQHMVFYIPSSPHLEDVRKAVMMYETRGLATSLTWDLPGDGNGNQSVADNVWARGRDAALNDCLYRAMHKFDWALFLDLDEFFVPRVTPDLPSFLRYLKVQHNFNASRTTDLVFPSTYFPPPTRARYKNLTTMAGFNRDINKFSTLKSVHRTYFDQKQTLRMLRPEAVARVGAGERKKTSFNLSHRYASVHHYSFCPRNHAADKGGLSCDHLKLDWTMWRFKSLLMERARSAVTLLDRG